MIKYINIPDNWTASQAWTVLDFIYNLEELIWDAHETKLVQLLGPDTDPLESMDDHVHPDDDDIPF